MSKSFAAVAFATCIALGNVHAAIAATPLQSVAPSSGTWLVWGGEINVLFNPDALKDLGLSVGNVNGATRRIAGDAGVRYESLFFAARENSVLEVHHLGNKVRGIGGGALTTPHGFSLDYAGGTLDLHGFSVRAASGSLFGLEITDAKGNAWFTADHAHYGFDDNARTRFGMHNMNLRLSAQLAAVLGQPELAGHPVGGLDFSAHAQADTRSPDLEGGVCSAGWPTAGQLTDIQMVYRPGADNWTGHDDKVYALRCSLPPAPGGGSCTGASTTGQVVLTPDSSLVNIGQTAVAWYEKFTANSPPYNNDQHPFLVWNLYRVDANGRIRQIAASGVKHAFTTINYNCSCTDPHVIYPTCEDTYAWQNNDNTTTGGQPKGTLGPRSEIIPVSAKWGRCGSIYDANCNGAVDAGSGPANLYQYRMNATESDLMASLNPGAKYYFEYWYVVRDDQVFYNTMGYREITAQKNGAGTWSITLVNNVAPDFDFFEGPVINRWVNPTTPGANADNEELSTPLGRARVAVKATDLGAGQWRYEYAVMNFDYAHVDIDPANATEPNLKVTANVGLDRFSVPLPGTATNLRFDDADNNAGNDWTATTTGGNVTWTAPAGASLAWGMLAHFEFTTNAPPAAVSLGLRGGATPNQAAVTYARALLGPGSNDLIFENSFE